jgi:hypothetical protein
VLTLRAAHTLLTDANSADGLAAIARAVGCAGDPARLDAEHRRGLSLGADVHDALVAPGPGALRAMLLVSRPSTPMRDLFARTAARLAARSAHGLWLLIGTHRDGQELGIASWSSARRPPRLSALVVNRARVVDADADTLRALAASAGGGDDLTTHARWLDALGREAMSRRFYRELEQVIAGLADSANGGRAEARQEIALLYASRLLFLAFLEAKGWLDGDQAFLSRAFDRAMLTGGRFHERVLLPLFFGTLNTPMAKRAATARSFGRIPFLNGGLFSPTFAEKQHRALRFSDAALGALVGDLFAHYRFTAREETASFEEAAIDPEMLGRTFESLMASQSRRTTGAFYTPHELVERVTSHGLRTALASPLGDHLAGRVMTGEPLADSDRRQALAAVNGLTILDPACGSGAFLVHSLERVAELRASLGDNRATDVIRRDVLTRTVFGVDVNPMAVWLCELRLWLAVAIESPETDPTRVPPLPNLDRNIRVGDSLAGPSFRDVRALPGGAGLRGLRARYARATGPKKAALARALDRTERSLALRGIDAQLEAVTAGRRELVAFRRGRDLFGSRASLDRSGRETAAELKSRAAELRAARRSLVAGGALPFSFPAHCADALAAGGFSVIVGNPPWVRPHRLAVSEREMLRRNYVVARGAAWQSGALAAGAGAGFGAQVDLAALFVERSLRLLAPSGAASLLVPAKLWRSLAAGGLRRLLADDADVLQVEDYADVPPSFDASVYPGLLVARLRAPVTDAVPRPAITASVAARERRPAVWQIAASRLSLDDSPGAPWLLVPAEVRRAFDRLRDAGPALADSALGRPLLGVKCGFNDAFLVRAAALDDGVSRITGVDGRTASIDDSLLRPIVRGQDVAAWSVARADESIVWTHDDAGTVLPEMLPSALRWLTRHRRALMDRSDLKREARWWTLFRTEAARDDRPRVVWADIAKSPRAAVLPARSRVVPLNSCYVARCRDDDDAFALAALLNSPLAAAWLDVLAEPARGGYRRFLGWTMALLPIPRDWESARLPLAALGRRATADPTIASSRALIDASLEAFEVTHADVAPLLAWSCR